ncbi:MAG: hypothetical protein GY874_06220 [Desulfobacteraceae bacterium]|nr:hypothetical protein [Desulfobacteraceae bacterium]
MTTKRFLMKILSPKVKAAKTNYRQLELEKGAGDNFTWGEKNSSGYFSKFEKPLKRITILARIKSNSKQNKNLRSQYKDINAKIDTINCLRDQIYDMAMKSSQLRMVMDETKSESNSKSIFLKILNQKLATEQINTNFQSILKKSCKKSCKLTKKKKQSLLRVPGKII